MDKKRRALLNGLGLSLASLPFTSSLSLAEHHAKYKGKKLGIALVGLGRYANRIADGLVNSQFWNLNGIVTGSPEKIPAWKEKWKLKDSNIFNYDNYDQLINAKDIDVVYICLPNSMHADFTIRAAKAGKHVICEKPMAVSVKEAEDMIAACDRAGVKLAIGYRLHFNPYHQKIIEWSQQKTFGNIGYVDGVFSINVGPAGQWRLDKKLAGGGSLMDVGIYCVQAARYATQEEPLSVTAQFGPITDREKFKEVENGISWQLKFPSGAYSTGYSAYQNYIDTLTVGTEQKTFSLSPAYSYGPLKSSVFGGDNSGFSFPFKHHQQTQMEAMGPLFLSKDPLPDHISGLEGLKDMKILMAIYKAARNGKPVKI